MSRSYLVTVVKCKDMDFAPSVFLLMMYLHEWVACKDSFSFRKGALSILILFDSLNHHHRRYYEGDALVKITMSNILLNGLVRLGH